MQNNDPRHKYERSASYEDYAIDLNKVYYQRILTEIRKHAKDYGRAKKILDIGCFDGTLVNQLAADWETFGIEGNVAAAKQASAKGVQTINQDLDRGLPFDSGQFQAVIAAEIIEHVYDTDAFLQEIRRVLAPGGMLVLSTPNIACLTNRLLLLFGKYPRYAEYKAGGAGHIRVYTASAIRDQIRDNGFEIMKYAGCNLPMPMHKTWIPEWLKKIAVQGGDFFPGLAGQVILTAKKIR